MQVTFFLNIKLILPSMVISILDNRRQVCRNSRAEITLSLALHTHRVTFASKDN